jgi:O-acetyl-ADP-ribose deacetylase (regulator of RNase III)
LELENPFSFKKRLDKSVKVWYDDISLEDKKEMLYEIEGDILTADCKYIAHQCNCKTIGRAAGLARFINEKFPYADMYKRNNDRIPGRINIMGNGEDERFVINMYAQNYPGRCNEHEPEFVRLEWFEHCLKEIDRLIEDIDSIAFPYMIGCGLAGGFWWKYHKMIKDFAEKIEEKGKGDVYIIELVS